VLNFCYFNWLINKIIAFGVYYFVNIIVKILKNKDLNIVEENSLYRINSFS